MKEKMKDGSTRMRIRVSKMKIPICDRIPEGKVIANGQILTRSQTRHGNPPFSMHRRDAENANGFSMRAGSERRCAMEFFNRRSIVLFPALITHRYTMYHVHMDVTNVMNNPRNFRRTDEETLSPLLARGNFKLS